ncbi:hypothetical protein Zmor_004870 [Zophobas morio]|uniref:Uncharacterized protein n=1 Tax=Zophobas morio TaxID=2755281 RepID=A0AA38IS24_9CUCU|nr:hypothetical protein Zmor_004870 [Zophobas morio]
MAIGVVPGSSTAHNNNDSESESCKTSKTWQNLKDTRISNFRLKHIVSVLVCALGLMMILITIFIIILSVRGNTTSKSTNVAAEESMLVDDSGNNVTYRPSEFPTEQESSEFSPSSQFTQAPGDLITVLAIFDACIGRRDPAIGNSQPDRRAANQSSRPRCQRALLR